MSKRIEMQWEVMRTDEEWDGVDEVEQPPVITASPWKQSAAHTLLLTAALACMLIVSLWIGVVTNALAACGLALAWWIRGRPRGWVPFLTAGLVAFHVAWGLLNRLTLAQTWMRPPGFLTVDGVLQLLAICGVALLLLLAGVWWTTRRQRATL